MEQSTFGLIHNGKVIRKAFADFADRVVGEVKDSEEATMKILEENFLKLENQIKDIADKIEGSTNKGSFKTKVENLKASLSEYDGIGNFEALDHQLSKLLEQLEIYVEQNRHKNLQIKTALLEQLKPFADSHEWKTATAAIKEIQQKWIKTGAVALEKREEIEGEFKRLISAFYDRKNEFYADLNKMMEEKEKDFEQFVEKSKSLLEINELGKLNAEIKKTKEEWKSLGKIKPNKHSYYWAQLQEVIKQALAQTKKLEKKKKMKPSKEVLKDASALLDKIEGALSDYKSLNSKALKSEWKSIGSTKGDDFSEKAERFYFLMDYIDERKFIDSLVAKKGKVKDQIPVAIRVCRDLLDRDRRELHNFEENLGKFNMSGGFDHMLSKKLEHQKRKVTVKQAILKDLQALRN